MDKQQINLLEIERFALHDGPGIRTTVFLKGCPLRCPWCANPESQKHKKQLLHFSTSCVGCGRCISACSQQAIKFDETNQKPIFDREKCILCGACASICPQNAIRFAGNYVSVEEIMQTVLRDQDYYEETKGGITLSGGEPLIQIEGVFLLLKLAKQHGLHTAIETTGMVSEADFKKVVELVDLFLFDLKHFDGNILKEVTGANLSMVLTNLRLAVNSKKQVIARVPVIPNFNFDSAIMEGIFEIAKANNVKKVDLLPYHTLGKSKYTQLGLEYPLESKEALKREDLLPFQEMGTTIGLQVTISGK